MEDFFAHKRVAVTGGAGFIGSYLVQELIRLGADVAVLLDGASPTTRLEGLVGTVRIHRIGVWRRAILGPVLQDIRPQVMFHLRAAINQVPGQAGKEYFFQVNVEDTKELVYAARELALEAFVNTGTIAEYGAAPAPFREDVEAEPISEYGESKLAATLWLKSFYEEHGFPVVSMRSSVVYGPGQPPHSYLIPNIIMSCLQKKDFHIASSGLQTRDPLFVGDDVQGLLMAAATPKACGEIINLGLGEQHTVLKIARLINQKLGDLIKVTTGSDVDRPGENEHYWQDIGKAQQLLGWSPQVSLEEGIQKTIAWYQEHYKDFI